MVQDRQREYETIYILRPNAGEDDSSKARERLEGVVENSGGHVLKFDDWGMRSLAYEIRDKTDSVFHESGIYQYYRYIVPPHAVAEVERNLRIFDPVIKFMTVKLDDDLIAEDRLSRPTEDDSFDVTPGEEE